MFICWTTLHKLPLMIVMIAISIWALLKDLYSLETAKIAQSVLQVHSFA